MNRLTVSKLPCAVPCHGKSWPVDSKVWQDSESLKLKQQIESLREQIRLRQDKRFYKLSKNDQKNPENFVKKAWTITYPSGKRKIMFISYADLLTSSHTKQDFTASAKFNMISYADYIKYLKSRIVKLRQENKILVRKQVIN